MTVSTLDSLLKEELKLKLTWMYCLSNYMELLEANIGAGLMNIRPSLAVAVLEMC